MVTLAQRIGRIRASPTIAVSTLAKELKAAGKDVINMGTGEPDFDTPDHIKEAAKKAISEGQTKYTAVPGTIELREAICRKFKRENGLDYQPDQILVSTGAKQAIMNLIQCVIDHDDEAVIIAPCWVSYPDMIAFCGGKPVPVTAASTSGYKVSPEQLAAAITTKTRLIMINSPSNPSGAVYTADELRALGEVVSPHERIVVCSDDIYEHVTYGGESAPSFASVNPQLQDRCAVVNGVSKAFAMTGWRIGYVAAEVALTKAMTKVQSQTTSNACSIAQAAAIAALDGGLDCIKPMLETFISRRDRVVAAFEKIEGLVVPSIDGAFYAFPDAREAIDRLHRNGRLSEATDDALCKMLLEGVGVAAVPGSAFEAPGCFRVSFAAADDMIEAAIERITKALS